MYFFFLCLLKLKKNNKHYGLEIFKNNYLTLIQV